MDIPPLTPYGKGYKITFNTSPEKTWEGVPSEYWTEFNSLYEEIEQNPNRAALRLKELKGQFPKVHALANLLVFVLLKLRKKKEAEALIEEIYHTFPDSLIAKVNYADQCLRKKKVDEVFKIFNGKFDLNQLFPDRKEFHFTEFRGFMLIMGFLHLRLKNRPMAQEYYELAFLVDPLHPGVISLEKQIKNSTPLLQKLARIIKIP